jgi:hypothetical protein
LLTSAAHANQSQSRIATACAALTNNLKGKASHRGQCHARWIGVACVALVKTNVLDPAGC